MTKTIAAVATVFAMFAGSATAAPFVWGNIYTDFVVNENAADRESHLVGIEGGLVTQNGTDVYGFYERNTVLENDFAKITLHTTLVGDFGAYGRVSTFKGGDFTEARYIVGAGYQGFVGDDYAIKPYVGALRIDVNSCQSEDQLAFGYAGYKNLADGVTLSSWVDARVEDSKVKASGSIGFQKDLTIIKGTYVGVFYNMNYGEAGVKGYSDSVNMRVGYHF